MARTKQPKLAAIIDNKALGNDLVIKIGDESLTIGELRTMDAETDGASTAALETRENNLVAAHARLAEILQSVSETTGIPLDKLMDGNLEGAAPVKVTPSGVVDDDEAALADIDPKVIKALEKKFGASAVASEVAAMKTELANTKRALGIALKINMDDHYNSQWKELSGQVPKGDDGKPLVALDLNSVLKYADDNSIKDKTGRYNLSKAFSDLTVEARHKHDLAKARAEGERIGQEKAILASVPKPGGIHHPTNAKPPVDDKGRVKSLDAVMQDALQDGEIQQMISGISSGTAA